MIGHIIGLIGAIAADPAHGGSWKAVGLQINWFVVLPIKGQPMGNGFRLPGVVVVPIVYGFWGFGMWVIAGLVRSILKWR